ncbi:MULTISPECIES: GNAT family N-acetyltransferase [Sphingopyxis]|uniref:GNAT family N-acetyltransferase n=1 Tax=Sphingopyxis TaxID=165697 RepID=UPI00086CD7D7|nr:MULTISPECIES: GNAT family N-acetyltransferase [Sphingopyxis]APW73046.1 GNAT family N-acetyltransferase [Sphingopyxis granuli]AVA15820.1 GNAT family N-acetyltransferase [Sphingopyxis sp. MG]ODU28793.1 MAG: GNAT family N-acetyltransferase [Sphingopyxis sp. SCN 67-31]
MTVYPAFPAHDVATHEDAAPLAVRVVDPLSLSPELAASWDALANEASEPNPFAERWCLQPALHLLDPERRARLVMVRDGDGGPVIGVMPLAPADRYGRLPLRHAIGWAHPNHFLGLPLVRAGFERLFWSILLGWCDAAPWARTLVHLPRLTEDGPLHRALADVAQGRGRAVEIVHREERALLDSRLSPDAYWQAAVRAKKRKELRRQTKRLADQGELAFRRWRPDEPLDPWIDAFLDLEMRGWKGRAGSALASHGETEAWFRATLAGAVATDRLAMSALDLDGRPLAMLIHFLCPPGGFSFKTAFDEAYARFSPGVLLQRENLDLLADPAIDWVDSCAVPHHPMIDSIWRERRRLVWVNVPLSAAPDRWRFDALTRIEAIWRRWKRPHSTPSDAIQDPS